MADDSGGVVGLKVVNVKEPANDHSIVFSLEKIAMIQIGRLVMQNAVVVKNGLGRIIDVFLADNAWVQLQDLIDPLLKKEGDFDPEDENLGSGHTLFMQNSEILGVYAQVRFWVVNQSQIIVPTSQAGAGVRH